MYSAFFNPDPVTCSGGGGHLTNIWATRPGSIGVAGGGSLIPPGFARQWPLGTGRRPGDPRDPANPIMGAETADTRAAHSVQPSVALPPAQLEGASSAAKLTQPAARLPVDAR